MQSTWVWWKAAIIPAALFVAGCATQQQTASVQCGAGGLTLGYLVCKATGGSDSTCAAVAAAAAGVGAAACYSYAGQLEKRKQALAGRENDLNAQLQYAKGLNEDGEKLNAELRQRVGAATQRVDELAKQNTRSAQQLAQERARLDDELKAAKQQVALQKNAFDEVKGFQGRRATPSQDLDAEITKQERLLSETQRQVDELASVRQRV